MKKRKPERHGRSEHPLYPAWVNMNKRCYDEKYQYYHRYGGRGISVCWEWNRDNPDGPKNFIDYIEKELGPRPKGYDFDRIDNDGNYEPGNVRWLSHPDSRSNTTQIRKNSITSKYRGVCWNKQMKKWKTQIQVNKRKKHLGYFTEEIDAAIAYDRYVIENGLMHTTNGLL